MKNLRPRKSTTSVTPSDSAWVVMFCTTLLERLDTFYLDKALRSIAAYFGFQLTK